MGIIVLKEESYAIVGAAMEVHSSLGCGFLESVYQEALEWELSERRIPFAAQVPISVSYKDRLLRKQFVADFLCFDQIIIEIKAPSQLTRSDIAQPLHYLKATGLALAMLMNFGAESFEWKRVVGRIPATQEA